jgi:hypothetical protein
MATPGTEPTLAVDLGGALTVESSPGLADTLQPQAPRLGCARYVVERELARGGMGRVSIAHDTLLDRTVAIKELLVSDASLAVRFQRELALTARLQHPSIVSIHDGGAWPTGEPFYVMRLVSGEPLDRLIARQDDLGGRIALLPQAIAMTDALAYAHSQGIIHRDLKPANVLVGDFGETVVIDWGLAKDIRAADDVPSDARARSATQAETVAGSVFGTPTYMAPEQARGEVLDERADVYALGAVLYHLLSGTPPRTGTSADEVVRDVCTLPPRPLADVVPGIPRDLLAIVNKAMAHERDDRYATAGALAIDLKRFQRGQLVGAHHYSTRQLVTRWIRKHRTAVGVAGVAVVVLAVVAIAGLRRITAEQHRAEQHRADAEDLMQFMLTDLHDKLQTIGKLDVLGAVANKEREYFRNHADELAPADQAKRVIALDNLAEVLAAQGDGKGAIAEARSALAIASAASPSELAAAHRRLGRLLFDEEQTDAATREDRESVRLARQLADRAPGDSSAHRALAEAMLELGRPLEKGGKRPEALAIYRDVTAMEGTFGSSDESWQKIAAAAHLSTANLLLAQDDRGAIGEGRLALSGYEPLAHHDSQNPELQKALFSCHYVLAGAMEKDDPGAALAEYNLARTIAQSIVARDTSNVEWQGWLSAVETYIGHTLMARGDAPAAVAMFRSVFARASEQAAKHPDDAASQRQLFRSHYDLGDGLWVVDQAAASNEYRAALDVAKVLAERDPANVAAQRDLSRARNVTAAALRQSDLEGALSGYRENLAAMDALTASARSDVTIQREYRAASTGIGDVLLAQGDAAGALVQYRADVTSATQPDAVFDAHMRVGDALVALHSKQAAVAEYRAAEAAIEAEINVHPTASRSAALADSHDRIADVLLGNGSRDAAVAELRAALDLEVQLAADEPDDPDAKRNVAQLRKEIATATRRRASSEN